jgi:hypothetical protein
MSAAFAAAATPTDIVELSESLDRVLTSLATCALLIRLRRPAIERFLDEEMRLQILRGLAVDAPESDCPGRQPLAAAATPIFEAALAFLRVHESYAEKLSLARDAGEGSAQ